MQMKSFCILFIVCCLLASCKEYVDTPLSPAEKKRVNSVRINKAPTTQIPLDVSVEDQVKLIGVDLSSAAESAGNQLVATFFIEALNESMEDNKIFIHFQCRGAKGFQNLDGRSITQRLLPLRQLKKGEIIADRIDFKISRSCQTGSATLYWGLFRGADRLKFLNAKDGAVSRDGRLVAARVQVRSVPKPIFKAHRTSQRIQIDGRLNEAVWLKAEPIKLSRIGGKASRFQNTRLKALVDDNNLYVGVSAADTDIWSTFIERDSNTWEQEVIEVFIDANGKGRNYLELQVSPNNIVFDGKFTRHRSDLAAARAWNMSGLETAVFVDGTLNQRDDIDKSYMLEMKIPIDQVPNGRSALKRGEWRVNFFRFDKAKDNQQQASGWSLPPVPDFHHLASFGRLKFDATRANQGGN